MFVRRDSLNDVTNIMGALFICITFLGTSNASGVQPIVAAERPVFYREVASGMYSQLPFAVAQVRAWLWQRQSCELAGFPPSCSITLVHVGCA